MLKTGAIVQARMGSTRLPGKVMLNLCGKPVLWHVIERLKLCKQLSEIIIATTNSEQDDVIADQAEESGVKWFRGSEEDVLARYYYAARKNNLDAIVRITSDCPLLDPLLIDTMLGFYMGNSYRFVANVGLEISNRSFPRGLDTEIFSFDTLQDAFLNAHKDYHREHVTPYIYEHEDNIFYYKNEKDMSGYRWTLDTNDDFKLMEHIYGQLFKGSHDFYMHDILGLYEKNPGLMMINAHIQQKNLSVR